MRASKKALRHNLYMLRCKHKLTQGEFAAKIGVSARGYQNVEWGIRTGSVEFWAAIKKEFNVPLREIPKLMETTDTE